MNTSEVLLEGEGHGHVGLEIALSDWIITTNISFSYIIVCTLGLLTNIGLFTNINKNFTTTLSKFD